MILPPRARVTIRNMAATLTLPTVSTPYASAMESATDMQRAITNVCRDLPYPFRIILVEPPTSPHIGILVHLDRVFARDELPVPVAADLHGLAESINASAKRVFPGVPWKLEMLKPPHAARFGLVIWIDGPVEAPYPRIVQLRAVLRPTNFYRRLLGLAPKEATP